MDSVVLVVSCIAEEAKSCKHINNNVVLVLAMIQRVIYYKPRNKTLASLNRNKLKNNYTLEMLECLH